MKRFLPILCLLALAFPVHRSALAQAQPERAPSDGPLSVALKVGMSFEDARALLLGYGYQLIAYDATEPGKLTEGLIDTGLLSALNHFQVRERAFLDEGEGAGQSFLLGAHEDRRLVVGFVDDVARAILQRRVATVRGGASPFDSSRLLPIRSQMAALTRACVAAPIKRDRYSNRFELAGRCHGGQAFIRYRPEKEMMELLVVGGAGAAAPVDSEKPKVTKPGEVLWQKKIGDEDAPGGVKIRTNVPPEKQR